MPTADKRLHAPLSLVGGLAFNEAVHRWSQNLSNAILLVWDSLVPSTPQKGTKKGIKGCLGYLMLPFGLVWIDRSGQRLNNVETL